MELRSYRIGLVMKIAHYILMVMMIMLEYHSQVHLKLKKILHSVRGYMLAQKEISGRGKY